MNNADKIQIVINTLETMNMPSTFDNVNKMLGIYRILSEVRDDLGGEQEDEEHADNHAE